MDHIPSSAVVAPAVRILKLTFLFQTKTHLLHGGRIVDVRMQNETVLRLRLRRTDSSWIHHNLMVTNAGRHKMAVMGKRRGT